jgi:hypothetical protein
MIKSKEEKKRNQIRFSMLLLLFFSVIVDFENMGLWLKVEQQ